MTHKYTETIIYNMQQHFHDKRFRNIKVSQLIKDNTCPKLFANIYDNDINIFAAAILSLQ